MSQPGAIDLSAGLVPVSTRVMNLSHFLTESARRHPDEIGFVWGAIDGLVAGAIFAWLYNIIADRLPAAQEAHTRG